MSVLTKDMFSHSTTFAIELLGMSNVVVVRVLSHGNILCVVGAQRPNRVLRNRPSKGPCGKTHVCQANASSTEKTEVQSKSFPKRSKRRLKIGVILRLFITWEATRSHLRKSDSFSHLVKDWSHLGGGGANKSKGNGPKKSEAW